MDLHSHRPRSLRRLLLPWALLAAILLYASIPANPANAAGPLADGQQAVVSADGDCLRLRQMPSLNAAELDCVDDGTVVTARGAQDLADGHCWEAVAHDGLNGWMAAEYLVPVNGEADDNADPCADADGGDGDGDGHDGDDGDDDGDGHDGDDDGDDETQDEPRVLPAPPPGGFSEGVAGTSDLEALVAAQTFEVASVWVFEPATQDFLLHIPGAPAFANSLTSDSLSADSVVMMLRSGEKADDLGEAPVADDEAPRGVANVLPTPPEGGFTLGVSGTNDPAVLAASQPFEVRLIAMLDVPSQIWLTYIPGAPDWVQSLTRGLLQPDSTVWVRAGAAPDPEPTATPEGTTVEARITYFYCNQGTIAVGIGDGGGFCGPMANGEIVHEGAAACSRDNFGQRFRIIGDPNGLTYTCKDTGNAVHGQQRDVWFDNSDDGFNWIREVGTTALVEILPE